MNEPVSEALNRRLANATMLPTGSRPEVTHWRRPRRRRGPTMVRVFMAVVALSTGGAGVVLANATPSIAVSSSPTSYTVGAARLSGSGDGRFTGDGALVMRTRADGSMVAAGDASHNGVDAQGQCLENADHRQVRCTFDMSGTGLSALDTWSSGGWQRRYEDGLQVNIAVSSPVPVPFPVGR